MSIEKLIDFAYLLNQQNDFKEILRLVAQKSANYLEAESSSVLMLNPRTRQTIKTMFKGGAEFSSARYTSVQNQVSGWMFKNGQGFLSEDITIDARFKEANFKNLPMKSVAGCKLQVEGIVLGCLIIYNKKNDKGVFTESDLALLDKIAVLSAPYLRNAHQIQQLFDAPIPEETLLLKYNNAGLMGRSKTTLEMLHAIEAAARCDVRVMLEGKSGTGKELVAHAIHLFSSRNQAPFVAIDCGAIPAHLFESELFGFEKGAFTGANQNRIGLIEEANGGTLFIDEIANLPLEMQAKLMRVLQENEIRPLGGNKTRKVDVRIISASSAPLKELVNQQLFREDLFYRLHVYPIYVPALSERKGDITILAHHFLEKYKAVQNKKVESYHETLIDFMKERSWPGNIRELENFVERLVTLTPPGNKRIDLQIIPQDLKPELEKFKAAQEISTETRSLNDRLQEYEEQILRTVLSDNNWNQSKAAQSLRMSEQNFRYRMKKLGIKGHSE